MTEKQEKALATMPKFTSADKQLIRDVYAKGASEQEFDFFLAICRYRDLNPFKGLMHLIPFGGKRIPVVGIHGMLTIAKRSGDYAGTTPVQFLGEKDDKWFDVWDKDEPPRAARIGVYMKGIDRPTMAVATWRQYAKYDDGKLRSTWETYPADMLEKCALAKALRRAFPDDTEGIYIAEEFGHEGIENIDHSPEASTTKNQHQAKAQAVARGKYSDNDIIDFGTHKDKKWCDIQPDWLEYVISDACRTSPERKDRAQWEIDKRAGNLPKPEPDNDNIEDADFIDDSAPMNEEDERKVLLASVKASKDILGNEKFQELCGGITKTQSAKHLSDVDTPGLREMDKILVEAVNEQLEGGGE